MEKTKTHVNRHSELSAIGLGKVKNGEGLKYVVFIIVQVFSLSFS